MVVGKAWRQEQVFPEQCTHETDYSDSDGLRLGKYQGQLRAFKALYLVLSSDCHEGQSWVVMPWETDPMALAIVRKWLW